MDELLTKESDKYNEYPLHSGDVGIPGSKYPACLPRGTKEPREEAPTQKHRLAEKSGI